MEQEKGSADAKGREQKASTDPVDSGSRESVRRRMEMLVVRSNLVIRSDAEQEVRPGQCRVQASVSQCVVIVRVAWVWIWIRTALWEWLVYGTVAHCTDRGGNCAGAECPLPFSGKESVGGSFFFSTQGQY